MRKPKLCSLAWLASLAVFCGGASLQAQLSDITQPGDPIVPTSNNSPGSEGVANAIDNQPTKYLNFDKLNTGFTVTPQVGLSVVQCITLTSANDAVERDPASYTLEGSYDGVTFTPIAAGPVPAFTTRYQRIAIRFENNIPYLRYRVIFPTVANEAAANSMQISEVELLGFLAPTDVTQPGDPLVPSSNNSPGSEGVANAIDNQPTKYLNFDKLNTGFTVTPSVGPTLVSGITLTSANDAVERDPASYQLEGSLDGSSFYPISAGSVPPFPSRYYKNYIFFPNARAYKSYRLIFPTVANEAAANSMQISEVELLGVVSDLSQDVTQPGDPIIPSSNNSPGSEGVANAIDNQPTKYLNFDKLNTGFTVSPQAGMTIVNGLTLTSANDAVERDPASYTLEGSYDGIAFTLISGGSVPAFPSRYFKNTILFNNNVPYLKYRLLFPTVANEAAANSMQISEVELLGVLAPTDVTVPGDPVIPSSNNSPGSEGVANAIDNQPTKYLNFDKLNTGFTVTPGVGDTIVSGLSLTSANDAVERDPASYTLTGSNDGSNYVAISSGPVPAFTARYQRQYLFFPDNTKSFKSYRLIFPTVANEAAANSMQISEVEFLGVTPGVVNTDPVTDLILRQPKDTPSLVGVAANFTVKLSGPWRVQWYRNGAKIPGANNATYSTPLVTGDDDGVQFQALVQSPHGQQWSSVAVLTVFTPSDTESVGFNFQGAGANGTPTAMLPEDIAGFHQQAYFNNLSGAGGNQAAGTVLNSRNEIIADVSVTWATSGEWGVGTGNTDPTERMFNGMDTSFATTAGAAQTVTFSGVPDGNHSLLLYTVQVPLEFFNMNFSVVTHDGGGGNVVQERYIRPLNADEYNPSPGYTLVTATTPEARSVGNMMRFDNLQAGADGFVQIRFYSPGRVQPPNAEPIRGPGLNAFQLLLNPDSVVEQPVITQQPVSGNGIIDGQVTLSVEATGPGLVYQWLKNGVPVPGANSSQLVLSHLQLTDSGVYSVTVGNAAGTLRSRNAVVNVLTSVSVTENLIAYFKYDEEEGTTAFNSVAGPPPFGLPGEVRLSGVLPDWIGGVVGNCLLFNHPDEYVFVTNYPKPRNGLTVAGWVASEGIGGPLVNNWVAGRPIGNSGQFKIDADFTLGIFTGQIEVGPNKVISAGAVNASPGDFHHFAMSANGVTLSTYWDGQLVNTVDYLGQINVTADTWLSMGGNLTTASPGDPNVTLQGAPLDGYLDDVAIWSRSLSGVEIQAIYNGGLAGQDVSQVPPVFLPRLNITTTGDNITVSWGAEYSSYVLEYTNELKTPATDTAWTPVNGVVNNSVTLPILEPITIFRLRK